MTIGKMDEMGIFEMSEDELLELPLETLREAYQVYTSIGNDRAEEEGEENPFEISSESLDKMTSEELVDIIIGERIYYNIY